MWNILIASKEDHIGEHTQQRHAFTPTSWWCTYSIKHTASTYLLECSDWCSFWVIFSPLAWKHQTSTVKANVWDMVSATIVYRNLIHASSWGFPAVRNGSLCAKSTEWHRRAVHFTEGSGVLRPSRPAEGRDELALRWRQHSGTEPMSTSTQQAQDPEWSGITGIERGSLFSFLFSFYSQDGPNTINHILRPMWGSSANGLQ